MFVESSGIFVQLGLPASNSRLPGEATISCRQLLEVKLIESIIIQLLQKVYRHYSQFIIHDAVLMYKNTCQGELYGENLTWIWVR